MVTDEYDEITFDSDKSVLVEPAIKKKNKFNFINVSIIIGVVLLLVSVYFILHYAQSEGFKCLQDPTAYALNHTMVKFGAVGK